MSEIVSYNIQRIKPIMQQEVVRDLKESYAVTLSPWVGCASSLVGHLVYVTGQFGRHYHDSKHCCVVAILDTVGNSWKWLRCEGPAHKQSSTVLYEDQLYWFGAQKWKGGIAGTCAKLDLTLDEWQACTFGGKGPGRREGMSVHLHERRKQILFFGGVVLHVKQNEIYLLDLRREEWVDVAVKGQPPEARWKHGSWMKDGVFYCAGGWSRRGDYASENVFLLHFGSFNVLTWSTLKTNKDRWNLTVFTAIPLDHSNSVLILGGIGSSRPKGGFLFNLATGQRESLSKSGELSVDLLRGGHAGVATKSDIIIFRSSARQFHRITLG